MAVTTTIKKAARAVKSGARKVGKKSVLGDAREAAHVPRSSHERGRCRGLASPDVPRASNSASFSLAMPDRISVW
jgi:hypothetical protein